MSVLRALSFAVSSKHLPQSVMKVFRGLPSKSKASADPWMWERPRTVELGGPLICRERQNEKATENIGIAYMVKPDDMRRGGLANDAQVGFR